MMQYILLISLLYCTGDAVYTNLASLGLIEVPNPEKIPSDTTYLNLKSNKIHYIHEGALCHIDHLNTLDMQNNALTQLGNLSCIGHSLKRLYLYHNLLTELPASTFEGLDVLGLLQVSYSQLTEFPDLWDVADTLWYLSLEGNKGLGGLLPSADKLVQLTELTHLYIKDIELTSYPDLTKLHDRLFCFILAMIRLM